MIMSDDRISLLENTIKALTDVIWEDSKEIKEIVTNAKESLKEARTKLREIVKVIKELNKGVLDVEE